MGCRLAEVRLILSSGLPTRKWRSSIRRTRYSSSLDCFFFFNSSMDSDLEMLSFIWNQKKKFKWDYLSFWQMIVLRTSKFLSGNSIFLSITGISGRGLVICSGSSALMFLIFFIKDSTSLTTFTFHSLISFNRVLKSFRWKCAFNILRKAMWKLCGAFDTIKILNTKSFKRPIAHLKRQKKL